jgi:hypothetical protein
MSAASGMRGSSWRKRQPRNDATVTSNAPRERSDIRCAIASTCTSSGGAAIARTPAASFAELTTLDES